MGPAAFSAGHSLVSRLLDEGVTKAVRRLGRACRLLEHGGVAEFSQRRPQLVAAVPDRRQQRAGNLRPEHRGRAQRLMRPRAEPVNARVRTSRSRASGTAAPTGATRLQCASWRTRARSRATKRTVPPRKKGSLAHLNAIRR